MISLIASENLRSKQTNLIHNQHYHISDSHLHHTDITAMQASGSGEPGAAMPQSSTDLDHWRAAGGWGSALLPSPPDSIIQEHTRLRTASGLHPPAGSTAVYNSLLAQNHHHSLEMNLYEVTQRVGGVCGRVTACHFSFFYSISFFVADN